MLYEASRAECDGNSAQEEQDNAKEDPYFRAATTQTSGRKQQQKQKPCFPSYDSAT